MDNLEIESNHKSKEEDMAEQSTTDEGEVAVHYSNSQSEESEIDDEHEELSIISAEAPVHYSNPQSKAIELNDENKERSMAHESITDMEEIDMQSSSSSSDESIEKGVAKQPQKYSAKAPMQYLNPMTLPAEMFLQVLQKVGPYSNEMDAVLCRTMGEIMLEIIKFIKKDLYNVRSCEKIQLITRDKFDCFQCVYDCSICKRTVGNWLAAFSHLKDGHDPTTTTNQKNSKQSASKEQLANRKANRKLQNIKLPSRTASLLNTDLKKFFKDNIKIADELANAPEQNQIKYDLTNLLKELYPRNKVYAFMFGSRFVGIANRASDLDIFANIGYSFLKYEDSGSSETLEKLQKVRTAMKNARRTWTNIQSIEKARVPIIMARHLPTGIDCDIGFSNFLGYWNSCLLRFLFKVQPIARFMCIFMKRWMDRSKIHDVSNYTITLLTVFYLQMRQALPPLVEILEERFKIGPWTPALRRDKLNLKLPKLKTSMDNWLQVQIDFFKFFANLNYNRFIICIYLGRLIPKTDINQEMPDRYNQWVKHNSDLNMTSIIVQDPLQLNHNVAKNISAKRLQTLTAYFDLSAKGLANHKHRY